MKSVLISRKAARTPLFFLNGTTFGSYVERARVCLPAGFKASPFVRARVCVMGAVWDMTYHIV